MLHIEKTVATLRNRVKMPLLGLGCWLPVPEEAGLVSAAVEKALDSGYRHIDTAFSYKNEEQVGEGIRNWMKKTGNSRDQVFVVTKLPMNALHEDRVERILRSSLKKLKLDFVDLYLIHGPVGTKYVSDEDIFPLRDDGSLDLDYGTNQIAVWKKMEQMVDLGLTKTIGISNFSVPQMRRILAIAKTPPAVNQVEMNVYFQQRELHKFCFDNDILVTAYAPLGSPGRDKIPNYPTLPNLLDNPVVRLIAENHEVKSSQVLVKFLLQLGVSVIPKSTNKERIIENGDVFGFTLSDLEMDSLKSLDKGEEGRTFGASSRFSSIVEHADGPK